MTDEFDLAPKLEIARKKRGGSKPARLRVERIEDVVDRRTLPGRELLAYRRDLVADVGSMTAAQERLIEQAVITRALLEIASSWALQHLKEGFGTEDDVLPWLLALDRLQERESRILKRLGLGQQRERRPKTMKDLLRAQARVLPPHQGEGSPKPGEAPS